MNSGPDSRHRARLKRAERLVVERAQPVTRKVLTPLPVLVVWDAGESLREYADKLAHANDLTVTKMLGKTSSPTSWRSGTPRLVDLMCLVGGFEKQELVRRLPFRYRPSVRKHWFAGWIDPDGADPTMVVGLLPDSTRSDTIRRDMLMGSGNTGRLNYLEVLAAATIPRLTSAWPPGDSFHDELRAHALRDPGRHGDPSAWSPQTRAYALLVLWDQAKTGGREDRSTWNHTTLARDLEAGGRWTRGAFDLAQDSPRLAAALRTAAMDWPTVDSKIVPPDRPISSARVSTLKGPFSVRMVAQWHPDTVRSLYAATVARHALHRNADPQVAWTLGALISAADDLLPPAPPSPWVKPWTAWQPPTFATDACRLIASDNGRAVIDEVGASTSADLMPTPHAARWWPLLTVSDRIRKQLNEVAREIESSLLRELIWIDITGHFPRRWEAAQTPGELLAAARAVTPDNVLALREWALSQISEVGMPEVPAKDYQTARARRGAS